MIAKRRKEEEEEEKDEGEEGQRCQENQTEMARRNAVMMKSAIAPFLDEEEMAFLDLMEVQEARKIDLAVEIHYACGWRGEPPDADAVLVGREGERKRE